MAIRSSAGDEVLGYVRRVSRQPLSVAGTRRRAGSGWSSSTSLAPRARSSAALTARTRIVALSHVQFVTGFALDLDAGRERSAVERGIDLVLDGAQSLGALPLEPASLGVAAVAASGWKWLRGPIGSGLMYTSADLPLDGLRTSSWGAETMRQGTDYLDHSWAPHTSAKRFEFSTSSPALVAALEASIAELFGHGLVAIRAHLLRLQDLLLETPRSSTLRTVALPGCEPLGDPRAALHACRPEQVVEDARASRLRRRPLATAISASLRTTTSPATTSGGLPRRSTRSGDRALWGVSRPPARATRWLPLQASGTRSTRRRAGIRRSSQRFLAALPADAAIVDVGCWNGAIAELAALRCAPWRSYTAIDVGPGRRRALSEALGLPRAQAIEGDVRALPLEDARRRRRAVPVRAAGHGALPRRRSSGARGAGAHRAPGRARAARAHRPDRRRGGNALRRQEAAPPRHPGEADASLARRRLPRRRPRRRSADRRVTRLRPQRPRLRRAVRTRRRASRHRRSRRAASRSSCCPGAPALFVDYVRDFDRVRELFAHDYRQTAALARAVDAAAARTLPRKAVADVLAEQQTSEAAAANVERLRAPGTVAIVTGQQPGAWRRARSTRSTRPRPPCCSARRAGAVPVFWIANDDHELSAADGRRRIAVGALRAPAVAAVRARRPRRDRRERRSPAAARDAVARRRSCDFPSPTAEAAAAAAARIAQLGYKLQVPLRSDRLSLFHGRPRRFRVRASAAGFEITQDAEPVSRSELLTLLRRAARGVQPERAAPAALPGRAAAHCGLRRRAERDRVLRAAAAGLRALRHADAADPPAQERDPDRWRADQPRRCRRLPRRRGASARFAGSAYAAYRPRWGAAGAHCWRLPYERTASSDELLDRLDLDDFDHQPIARD